MEVRFSKSRRNWDLLFPKFPQNKLNLTPSFLALDSEEILSQPFGGRVPFLPNSPQILASHCCQSHPFPQAVMRIKTHWTTSMHVFWDCTVHWNPGALWVLCHPWAQKSIQARSPGSWDIASLNGLPSQCKMSVPFPSLEWHGGVVPGPFHL